MHPREAALRVAVFFLSLSTARPAAERAPGPSQPVPQPGDHLHASSSVRRASGLERPTHLTDSLPDVRRVRRQGVPTPVGRPQGRPRGRGRRCCRVGAARRSGIARREVRAIPSVPAARARGAACRIEYRRVRGSTHHAPSAALPDGRSGGREEVVVQVRSKKREEGGAERTAERQILRQD